MSTAPGRGIGLVFVISGVALMASSAVAFAYPRIRLEEDELPDMLPETPPQSEALPQQPATVAPVATSTWVERDRAAPALVPR